MIIDDEMLMAYLDGELDEIRRVRVDQALDSDAELRQRLETQRRLRERLSAHYGPVLDEEVPARLRKMLESNVVDLPAKRMQFRRAWPAWQSVAALAATLVLGVLLGRSVPGESGPVAVEDSALIARGELAETLDTQLASAQARDASTRIGVSFARGDGRLCRTFDSPALAGLACRQAGEWQLIMTAPGSDPRQSQYRQVGSASPQVLHAAQEMMAGEPLDTEAERRARDSGWESAALAD